MSSIELQTWDDVREYIDASNLRIPPSYLDRVNSRKYPLDAFTLGQLASKAWLLDQHSLLSLMPTQAAILGNWVGALVEPLLLQVPSIKKIYGIDIDAHSVELSDQFNARLVQDNWKYKGVVADATVLNCSDMELEIEGQIINYVPDLIINTSCEHMSDDWFDTVSKKQLVVLQTNNSNMFDGHINICYSQSQMRDKYPMSKIIYSGELKTPIYTRFMMIGYK